MYKILLVFVFLFFNSCVRMDVLDETFYGENYVNSWELVCSSKDRYFLNLKNKNEVEFSVVDYDKDGSMELIATFDIKKRTLGIYDLYDYQSNKIGYITIDFFKNADVTLDFTVYKLKKYLGE